MAERQVTYTVLHSAGEMVDNKNIRPYQTFKAVPTPEYKEKVKKGYLREGAVSEEEINKPNVAPKSKSRRSTRKSK